MIYLLILMFFIIVCTVIHLCAIYKVDKQFWYYKETYKGRKILTRYGLTRIREIVNSKRSKF